MRASILSVARSHFQSEGYDGVAMRRIAEEVGVAEGTMFNYFRNKANLFLEIMLAEMRHDEIGDVVSEFIRRVSTACGEDGLYREEVQHMLYSCLMLHARPVTDLPKEMIRELICVVTSMMRKRPDLFRRMMSTEVELVDHLEQLMGTISSAGLLRHSDAKTAAESIYALFLYELLTYVHDHNMDKCAFAGAVRYKLSFLLEGYFNDNDSEEGISGV